MNAPSHALINLVLLARRDLGRLALPVVLGATLPDLGGYLFYLYYKLGHGLGEAVIWGELYPRPFWQDVLGPFHSIPFALLLLGVARLRRAERLALFALSWLLHCLIDLPLHHTDAPRFFFPFSDWRFRSPLSYWDRAFHAGAVALVEVLLCAAAAVLIGWKTRSRWGRATLLLVTCAMGALYVSGLLFWNSVPPEEQLGWQREPSPPGAPPEVDGGLPEESSPGGVEVPVPELR